MAKRFSVQRPLEMISEEGEKLWEMMLKRKRSQNMKIVFLSIQSVTVSLGSYNKLKCHKNLPRRGFFLEELGKVLVNSQIQRRQTPPASAVIVWRIQEEDAGVPSAQHTEPAAAEPGVSVWCYCARTVYVCLFYVICVWAREHERKKCKIPTLQCVWA